MLNTISETIEEYRDRAWRRTPELRIESAIAAEGFIEEIGFCGALTDAKQNYPSLYIAVCGRRDAFMPRNVQKDPEASFAWVTKDEVMRRGKVYYAKLLKGKSTFVAPRLVPHFNALFGIPRKQEKEKLSDDARAILKVLRKEWEMATADLREESGVKDRKRFTKALDELQRAMKVIPGEVLYEPFFTYIWSLAEGRWAKELATKVKRDDALKAAARAYLKGAGLTARGELARLTGLSRVDAGRGNHLLVNEGFAERLETGVYRLRDF
ncbi:MAG: crosslink repair DNA glycosylase YcaQ family protein [Acidobacteriota bacterium]